MVKIIPIQKTNSLYNDNSLPFKCFILFYKTRKNKKIKKYINIINIIAKIFAILLSILICGLHSIYFCVFYTIIDSFVREELIWYLLIWYSVFFIQHLLYVFILTRIKEEKTFCTLIQDLRAIDLGLKIHYASYNLEIKLFISVFVCFLCRVLLYFAYCIHFETCVFNWKVFLLYLVFVASDVVHVTYAFMFYVL